MTQNYVNNTIEPIPPVYPGEKQIWGPWATAGLGLAIGVVFFIIQSLTVGIFAIFQYVNSADISLSQILNALLENGDLLTAATIASAVICGGLIVIMVKARHGAKIREYLALKRLNKKTIILVLAIGAAFLVFSIAAGYFLPKTSKPDYITSAYENASLKFLYWIAVVVFAPIFEETFMRGFLFIGFRQSRLGAVGAVILTSLLWAGLHLQYDIFQMALIFVLGIVLGTVRQKTDSLWSPIIIHSLNNLVAMIAISL